MPQVIALNGAPGVGKTTLLNLFKLLIPNSFIIPEYIDELEDADMKLKQYLEGTISAYQFQDYILDYFESVANRLTNSIYDYIFVERTPIEGILCFAHRDLINQRMTQVQYNQLLHRAKSLTFYPNPLEDESITIYTDNLSPCQIVQHIISSLPSITTIKLRASLTTLKTRIHQRGRQCEIQHYNDDYLKEMIETYQRQ